MQVQVKIQNHFALFESAEEGGFNVSFPDFPGCVTFGKDFTQAAKMAEEVLELWIISKNKSDISDVVEDFKATGLYGRHFLKDLKIGLGRSNYIKFF